MGFKSFMFWGGIALLMAGGVAAADAVQYSFHPDEELAYEIVITTQGQDSKRVETSYLQAAQLPSDDGQLRVAYRWDCERNPASLEWMFQGPLHARDRQFVIDPSGKFLDAANIQNDAQLGISQGPAWRLIFEPLPSAGQTNWTEHRDVQLILQDNRQWKHFNGDPFGDWNQPPKDNPTAKETITYSAEAPSGNQLKIHRHYDLATGPDITDERREHIYGEGTYVFDVQNGHLASLAWNLNIDANTKNGPMTVPFTVEAHLMTQDELKLVKADADADAAQMTRAYQEQQAALVAKGKLSDDDLAKDYRDLPHRIMRTQMIGEMEGGGLFAEVSKDRKPLIGFRIKPGVWFDKPCFDVLEPLFSKPTLPEDTQDVVDVIARDGYAVGGVTISSDGHLSAIRVTFMKITGKSLDPAESYTSKWFGPIAKGTTPIELGGKGAMVYGIVGRRSVIVSALGLALDNTRGGGGLSEADAEAKEADEAARAKLFVEKAKAELTTDQNDKGGENMTLGELPDNQLITDPNNVPSDMVKTQLMGAHTGGLFIAASKEKKPVLGFLIQTAEWDNRVVFRTFVPLYATPNIPPPKGMVLLMAKNGYAVGSMTVNAGQFVNALCVRFMKITDTGLDPNTSYVSPWYGKKVGTSQTKLDGKGAFVYGIFGQKGYNVDALGLVIAAPTTQVDDGNKPL